MLAHTVFRPELGCLSADNLGSEEADNMCRFSPLLVFSCLIASAACAGDWPTYLNDNARVGATSDSISDDLQLKWVTNAPAKPELSFGGPREELIEGKEMRHRVAYDKSLYVAEFGTTLLTSSIFVICKGFSTLPWQQSTKSFP